MSFEVTPDAYGRFMGRYSEQLAVLFGDLAGSATGRVLDVGCGPGALTAELARRFGPARVAAVDPSASFVAAASARLPGVDVRGAGAEDLPFADGEFDATLAQLVVHFMTDPIAGLREMARVTRSGGALGTCVWDHQPGGRGPLATFWRAALSLDPAARDESGLGGTREGQLVGLASAAGWHDVAPGTLSVRVEYSRFEDWWEPFTLGVGPAGAYVATLSEDRLRELRDSCRRALPPAPFGVDALAWTVRGTA